MVIVIPETSQPQRLKVTSWASWGTHTDYNSSRPIAIVINGLIYKIPGIKLIVLIEMKLQNVFGVLLVNHVIDQF